jgi:hypothetical protein
MLSCIIIFITIPVPVDNLVQRIKEQVSVTMSSTSNYNVPETSWNSSNAVDNVYLGDPNTCRCCASTLGTESPWIQLDLGRIYRVSVIKIFGRFDEGVRLIFS